VGAPVGIRESASRVLGAAVKRSPLKRTRRKKPQVSDETRAIVISRWDNLGCACGCLRPVNPTNPACWHHVLPKARWPELVDEPDCLVLVAVDCHADHEVASRRLPRRVAARAERLAVTEPQKRYLETHYAG
jgi:hypothetical protein